MKQLEEEKNRKIKQAREQELAIQRGVEERMLLNKQRDENCQEVMRNLGMQNTADGIQGTGTIIKEQQPKRSQSRTIRTTAGPQ